jgi:L-ascorbate metabolism protein UlaG (beta-lactamase superfamily)
VLIELGGVRLLTDPLLRSRVMHLRRRGAVPAPPERIDAVLLSHLHYDHLDLPSLRMLAPMPALVCPTGAGRLLERAGFPGAHELLPGESLELNGLHVEATAAAHGGSRLPWGLTVAPLGFVVRGERSVYFAGDTDLFDEMAKLGPVDAALLPVAGYAPKLGPGHLDERRAAQAAALLRARVAVPIHWGTYHPMAQSRGAWFSEPGRRFAACAAGLAPDVQVRLLAPGESLAL